MVRQRKKSRTVEPPQTVETVVEKAREFYHRHKGHRLLERGELYALSPELIEALTSESRTFFKKEDEAFERDLAATEEFCFFYGEPFRPRALSRDLFTPPQEGPSVEEMMREEMRQAGLKDHEIRDYERSQNKLTHLIQERQKAYVGWLVINPTYRRDIATLASDWAGYVASVKRFPSYPRTFGFERTEYEKPFYEACLSLYRRWGLDRLITWSWPVPMEPDFQLNLVESQHELLQTGLLLFAPWYLLRGEKLSLQQVAQVTRTYHAADHLRPWLNLTGGKGADAGEKRFSTLLTIYRYYHLALHAKYGPQLRDKRTIIDRALGSVLGRSADSIKKLRLKLQRALS